MCVFPLQETENWKFFYKTKIWAEEKGLSNLLFKVLEYVCYPIPKLEIFVIAIIYI